MNRAKLLRLSITLANSLYSTRQLGLRSLNSTQVTHFSQLTQSPLPVKPYICSCNIPFNFPQNLYFSSKSESSYINLVLSNDWSDEIEKELEKLCPNLTHQSVLYDLVKLSENPQKSLDFFRWVCAKKGFRPSYAPYCLLLKVLACKQFMGEFWKVFSEMEKNGIYIDEKTCFRIHMKLLYEKLKQEDIKWKKRCEEMAEVGIGKEEVELILSSDWGEEVKGVLKKKLDFPLTEALLLRIICQLRPQPLKALKFFEWVGSCGGYEHDSVTYNTMATVLAQPESVGEFWDFVKQMRNDGHEIDIIAYMRSWRHLPIKDAVELFVLMMDGPYQPSLESCHSLMMHITREPNQDLDAAYRVFDKVVAAGMTPIKLLYDGVHKILCSFGRFDDAKKFVEDMRKTGFEPDNVTYNHEVSGLCKIGRFEDACKVLEQMEAKGCDPDIKTWTSLIRYLCSASLLDMALSCFAKMKEKNVQPNPETLSALLQGYISENKLLDAYSFLIRMVKEDGGLKPLQSSYNLMIEKLSEAGKLEEAFQLLSLMKKQQLKPFSRPITQYISKFGTINDAKRLMNILGPKSSPSTTSYDKIISAFFEQGRHSEAKALVYLSPPHVRNGRAMRELFGYLAPPSESLPHVPNDKAVGEMLGSDHAPTNNIRPHVPNNKTVGEMSGSDKAPPVEQVWKMWEAQQLQR